MFLNSHAVHQGGGLLRKVSSFAAATDTNRRDPIFKVDLNVRVPIGSNRKCPIGMSPAGFCATYLANVFRPLFKGATVHVLCLGEKSKET